MKSAAETRAALVRLVESEGVIRVNPPLLLPAAPYFDLAGEEFGRRLLLTTAQDGVEYCLRPDFTLPIASDYLVGNMIGTPTAYSYLGTVFRQRTSGPAEIEQAGLELLGQPDAGQALDQVLTFARWALAIYGVNAPQIKLGGIGLFEAFLAAADMPDAWRTRIRARFGHPDAMARLLERLANPQEDAADAAPDGRDALVEIVTDAMISGGLSPHIGRSPEEVADRYLEKQALAAARLPKQTVSLLRTYLSIAGRANSALDRISSLTNAYGLNIDAELNLLRRHAAALSALSPKAEVQFDASFSPRLDYYTGIVFEIKGRAGTILASGGEYDRLLDRLGAETPVTASGCAIWVQRLEREARNA
ncbi:MAG TPA: ATP phosphoribosyltransferase regulatory subunit [Arsenicitalea sp.]|jgi:ATP phosphoribosyltransferase regulatory subunit|nr:ATP phosphoribosyltransferase regulatory subunit [Arsenicitalea sp.]